jgi:hypothetical protein
MIDMIDMYDDEGNENRYPEWLNINLIPKNLEQASEVLACFFSKDDKVKIRSDQTDPAAYSNLGSEIRNAWNLWSDDEEIILFFESKGITSRIDMTEIILLRAFSIIKGEEEDEFKLTEVIKKIKGQ